MSGQEGYEEMYGYDCAKCKRFIKPLKYTYLPRCYTCMKYFCERCIVSPPRKTDLGFINLCGDCHLSAEVEESCNSGNVKKVMSDPTSSPSRGLTPHESNSYQIFPTPNLWVENSYDYDPELLARFESGRKQEEKVKNKLYNRRVECLFGSAEKLFLLIKLSKGTKSLCRDVGALIYAICIDIAWKEFLSKITIDLRQKHIIELENLECQKHPFQGRNGRYIYPNAMSIRNVETSVKMAAVSAAKRLQDLHRKTLKSPVFAEYWHDRSSLKALIKSNQTLLCRVEGKLSKTKKQISSTYRNACDWIKWVLYNCFVFYVLLVIVSFMLGVVTRLCNG